METMTAFTDAEDLLSDELISTEIADAFELFDAQEEEDDEDLDDEEEDDEEEDEDDDDEDDLEEEDDELEE